MKDKAWDNKSFTAAAGLHIYDRLWDQYQLDSIIDCAVPKHSGKPYSSIVHNLFNRNLIDADSMVALAEKDKEEYFLAKNAALHRTTYGRNLKRPCDKQRRKILLKFNDGLIPRKEVGKHAIMILDQTAVEVSGEEYENTQWVWDSCQEKMVRGYCLNKLMLKTKKKVAVIDYNVNNECHDSIVTMFKKGRTQYGINKVVIDADPKFRGMEFYKQLSGEEFLFYTKAVKDWKFNYGFDMNTQEMRKRFMPLLKRNSILSRTVYKDDMMLRLVFVLGDKRVILTNDFKSSTVDVYKFYVERWKIETSFREEKQNLGLDKLPCWNTEGVKTHFLLCILAYVLSQFIISKVKIADGIKLVKRRLVKVWALLKVRYGKIVLEFDVRYRHASVFYKLLE